MEMNSFAGDKVGPGDETATPKKTARKSTASVKNKDQIFVNPTDAVSFQIYEVLGSLQEQIRAAVLANPSQNPDDGGPSIVLGNEVLLSLSKTDEPPNTSSEDRFLDITCRIQTDKTNANKYLPFFDNESAPYTFTANKMIIREAPPRTSADGTNADGGREQGVKVCGSLNFFGRPFLPELRPRVIKTDVDEKPENEKLSDEVSSMETMPEEGVAGEKIDGMVEASKSDTEAKNESFAIKENAEKNMKNKGQEGEKDVCEVPIQVKGKVPQEIPGNKTEKDPPVTVNQVKEVVVSSGFAWGRGNKSKKDPKKDTKKDPKKYPKKDQPKSNSPGNVKKDDKVVGELKKNESGSVESVKKVKRPLVAEHGNAVEVREGMLVEKMGQEEEEEEEVEEEEEEEGAIQDKEIGSVAEEIIIDEGNKRKRIQKGEEAKKLNPKKRKMEMNKNDSNDFGDGKDKGKSQGDKGSKKDSAKPGSSICDQSTLEETIDRVASGYLSLPFIENLRGEIKNLSRADLEELIVQKLCEVITERSVVGDLRKRAEALEKNQERWKEKVLSLTKQIKEMDMVMKNYLSEVRRLHAEKSFQMVAPLRVTRSVGLQVSFTASPSKLAKTTPKSSGGTHHRREKGGKNPNRCVHVSQPPNKKIPILPTTSSKKPLAIDPKTKFSTKSGLTITLQPASSSSETQLASKPIPIQQPKLSILPATDSPSASLIDLTGDDDRQVEGTLPVTTPQTVTVGPPGQVKVVNHIQPAQSSAGAATLFLPNGNSPTCCSSTVTTTSQSQNRQLAIPGSSMQTPQRHIIPTIPNMIYKPNTLIQPGSQASQVRAPVFKTAKHPAPLPQPPANQMYKPNWKLLPPRPSLKISKGDAGIVLSWNMPLSPEFETVVSYQLFAYQESDSPPSSSMWKRVGEIKALRLPMACTLTQFLPGHKYYFAVRAVDVHSRVGPFSIPGSITLIR